VVTGNWLSGGSSSRYPAGNRFEEPFEVRVAPSAVPVQGPGANVRMLLTVADNVVRGLQVDVPKAPPNVRVIY
jgi:hypothetical protein